MVVITSAAHCLGSCLTGSSQKVESWSTVLLFPAETVVSSSCAAVLVGWVHYESIQQCCRQKEHSLQTPWGSGDKSKRFGQVCNPSHTLLTGRFQLHGCTSYRCSVHVSTRTPPCFCLSAQHRFMISLQDKAERMKLLFNLSHNSHKLGI